MPEKRKPMTTFAIYAKNLVNSTVSIGHQTINDWLFHCSIQQGKKKKIVIRFFVAFFWHCFFWHRIFFCRFNLFECKYSGAATAKEGLIAKGYHVEYANAKPATSNGSGGGGYGGRMKRDEFRSTHISNGGSENGGSHYEINDTESLDNR